MMRVISIFGIQDEVQVKVIMSKALEDVRSTSYTVIITSEPSDYRTHGPVKHAQSIRCRDLLRCYSYFQANIENGIRKRAEFEIDEYEVNTVYL